MACFQVDADVLAFRSQTLSDLTGRNTPGASSSTHPVPQDASKSLEAVHALFAAADASSHNEERPQKRRKIDADSRYASLSTSSHVDHSAVLAKVSIDLNFAPVVTSMSPNEGSSKAESPLVLSLESFSGPEASRSRIVLFDATSNSSIDILAAVDLESYQSVKPHIKAAESLACTKLGRKKTTKPRAAFARCILSSAPLTSHMYKLVIEVRWLLGISVVESPAVSAHLMKEDLRLLSTYFRSATAQSDARWALSDFYDSVYVPPVDLHISPQIQHKLVDTTLYPFQQRAVNWLLRREGVAYSASGHLEALVENVAPASFNTAQDANGTTCYVSGLRGMVVTDLQAAEGDALQSLKGGILAEEMGLGKTVELIGLISHHKRQAHNDKVFDIHTGAHVRTSGATLIITPPSILEQWRSEIHTHAPNLKVLHYKGLPSSSAPKREHAAATVEELLRYDVVLTTYGVLSKEIHYATPPPDRSSRHERRHERRKSPLVDISWWRVCLDEAQMVESGVSNAARVARVIPRINAWAVSGTPLRKDIQDLRGLLTFLRCDTFAQNKLVWSRLDKSSFYAIFNQITLRHTKDKVRNDLRLPPQKRAVITIPFTAIEEQNYADLVRQMCDECWLGPEGEPLNADSDPSSPDILERMCEWLVRLRQTCLHAHVGRKNKRALGARNGPLRTVHEVLEIMIEQNSTRWKADARETILNRVKMGHVKAYAGDIENRAENALPFFTKALEETQVYVSMCRQDLEQEQRRLGVSATVLKHDEDSDAEEAEREDMGNIASLRRSLRSFLELEHMCKFFIATTHHQIKDYLDKNPGDTEASLREEQLETEWYDQAKTIRRELLREVKNTTQRQMNKIEKGKPFEQLPNVEELPDLGGIESRRVLETIDEVSDFLNAQAAKVQEWRTKIVDILLLRLTDDDDDIETTGEEYETSLKAQDELYVSIMALRTLVADRNLAVHGLQDHLINEELKTAIRHARDDDPEKRGHAPELLIEFSKQRAELMSTLHGGSLKGVIAELRSKIVPLQWRAENDDHRAAAESTVLQKHLSSVQSIMSQQIKALLEMEKEQEMFRATMNQRLEYYRQFQHISDTVAAYKEELDEKFDQAAFQIFDYRRSKSLEAVNTLKGKHAYLVNLRAEDQKSAATDCIICQETIEVGVLTTCGHKYCKECINQWWHAHRTCPLCKQKLKSSDFKDISLKPSELPTKADTPPSDSPPQAQASIPKTTDMSIYSDISETTLKEIKMIDLPGSYGSKIDMLAKHLLWIRANDPGAKSVIFSQYRDFLEVLESAFRDWKIVCSNIREKDGIVKFKRDPATEAFLLDAKSDSSGLNLVNATYVFLCEPLINPAIELQAIARVHRIGQQRPTTVFMYLISNTVEEAIYDISVARRLEHMKSSSRPAETSGAATPVAAQEKSLDKANSAEMEAAPLKQLLSKGGGGEAVKNDDLWQCLFGKPRKSPGLRSEEQMRVTVGL